MSAVVRCSAEERAKPAATVIVSSTTRSSTSTIVEPRSLRSMPREVEVISVQPVEEEDGRHEVRLLGGRAAAHRALALAGELDLDATQVGERGRHGVRGHAVVQDEETE